MKLKELSLSQLIELQQRVEDEIEKREVKRVVVLEVMEKVKEMGLDVSDLLTHFRGQGRKSKKTGAGV